MLSEVESTRGEHSYMLACTNAIPTSLRICTRLVFGHVGIQKFSQWMLFSFKSTYHKPFVCHGPSCPNTIPISVGVCTRYIHIPPLFEMEFGHVGIQKCSQKAFLEPKHVCHECCCMLTCPNAILTSPSVCTSSLHTPWFVKMSFGHAST